jgi:hypothetical protein
LDAGQIEAAENLFAERKVVTAVSDASDESPRMQGILKRAGYPLTYKKYYGIIWCCGARAREMSQDAGGKEDDAQNAI